MKAITLMILMMASLATLADQILCVKENTKVIINIHKDSVIGGAVANYNQLITQGAGSVSIYLGSNHYEFKNNIYIINEGQGNIRVQVLGLYEDELKEVINFYFDHELGGISGFYRSPKYSPVTKKEFKDGRYRDLDPKEEGEGPLAVEFDGYKEPVKIKHLDCEYF